MAYEDLFDPADDNKKAKAGLNLRYGIEAAPDLAARDAALAKRYGLPAGVIEQYRPDYDARAKVEDAGQLLDQSPKLRDWLAADPVRAKVSHDDIGNLSAIEQAVRYLVSAPDAPRGGLLSDVGKAGRSLAAAAPGFGAGAYGAAAAPFEVVGLDAIGGWLRSQQKNAEAVSKDVAGVGPDAGFLEQSVLSGFQSAGQNLLTLPLGFAAKGEALMLGAMGLVTGGQSYGKGRDAGLDPAQAAVFGIQDATAEIVTEKFLGAAGFLKQIKAGASAGKLFGYQVLKETPGEIGATLWQNFNEWGNVNPDKSVADFLAEQPEAIVQTVIATIVGGSVQIGAVKGAERVMGRFDDGSTQATRAQMSARQLDAIAALAEASKLKARSPETFAEFANELAQSSVPAIFIDAQALMQSGVNIQEVAQAMPSVAAQLQQAVATGGDIEIPAAEFVQAVPGSTFQQQMIDHARTGANAMSRAEAEVFMKDKGDAIKAEIEAEAARHEQDADWQLQRNEVRDGFEQQLNAAGRFQPAVNKQYAAVLGDFYAVTASRAGMTPKELVQRYPLRIQAAAPGGAANSMEQTAQLGGGVLRVDATRTDQGSTFHRLSIMDAGEPVGSVGLKETADRVTIQGAGIDVAESRGKGLGIGAYVQMADYALAAGKQFTSDGEVSAEAARMYEALERRGYRVERSSRIETLEDGTLATNHRSVPVFRVTAGPAQALNQSAALPATIDIDGQQRSTTNSKGQQIAATEEGVRNFYRWFGDSRVVDDQGRPLVVYHVTNGDFGEFKTSGNTTSTNDQLDAAFFTDSTDYAEAYAEERRRAGLNTMPVYVRIENGAEPSENPRGFSDPRYEQPIIAQARADGEDGVVFRDSMIEANFYAAFEPGQIKSAIGNNGAFDPTNPSILNQFAGPSANTADTHALDTARQRIAAGEDAEAVRQDTGWHQGADGKWRFEISDADAKLKPALKSLKTGGYAAKQIKSITYQPNPDGTFNIALNPPNLQKTSDIVELVGVSRDVLGAVLPPAMRDAVLRGEGEEGFMGNLEAAFDIPGEFEFGGFNALPLDEALAHPTLFSAYPALRDVMVQVDPKLGIGGAFLYLDHADGATSKVIRIGTGQQLSTLLHEVQHGIQDVEGFASGGAASQFSPIDRFDSNLKRAKDSILALMRQYPEAANVFREWNRARIAAKNGGWSDELADIVAQVEEKLTAMPGGNELWSAELDLLDLQPGRDVLSPQEQYQRLAGEVEARNTQARASMSDAQRAATPPDQTADVNRSDVIVTFNGTDMASAPTPANATPTPPRAQISFGPSIADSGAVISLLENADLSSFIHEAGHLFLEIQADLAARIQGRINDGEMVGEGERQIVADMNRLLEWFGVKGTDQASGVTGGELEQGALPVRPPREDVEAVAAANFGAYRLVGNRTVAVSSLTGGTTVDANDAQRVAALAEKLMGPDAYIERLIVDDAGTVIEGQHRLDALRAAGIKRVPVVVIQDLERGFPKDAVRSAIEGAQKMRTDHVNQITAQLAEIYADEKGDIVEVRRYAAPRGFEAAWSAGVAALEGGTLAQGGPDIAPPAGPSPQGRTALETWSLMSLDEKRQHHETFARGWERYAFEGNSPSLELQTIFQRFAAWMKSIYRTLTSLNVNLTDEVRGVMDRMIATEDQIKEAETARAMGPLFAGQGGMTPEQWAAYQAQGEQATQTAVDALQSRALADMKWLSNARAAKLRELQKQADALRREIRLEVTRDVMSRPVYRAWAFLTGKGEADQQAQAAPRVKGSSGALDPVTDNIFRAIAKLGGLNRDEVASQWGIDPKEKLESGVFGKPVVRRNGGLSIDAMVERLVEQGYLLPDENGKADQRDLEEAFDSQRRGHDQFSTWHDYAERIAAANGEQPIDALPEHVTYGKLDTNVLREMYGTKAEAVWRKLSDRRMTSESGIQPDVLAETMGFASGDAMVRELANARAPRDLIRDLTDQRMLQEHGELATAEGLERATAEALANRVRTRFLATELQALEDAGKAEDKPGKDGKPRRTASALDKAAEVYAVKTIGAMAIKDIRPHKFEAAATRAAKLAAKAHKAGKLAEAAMHKRSELIQMHAAKAAHEALAEVEKAKDHFGDIARRSLDKLGKSYDIDVVQAIRAVLSEYGIGSKGEQAAKYLDAVERNDPDMHKVLKAQIDGLTADAKPIDTLTVDGLRSLVDEVGAMWHLARRSKQMEVDGNLIDREEVQSELLARLEAIGIPDTMPGEGRAVTDKERRISRIREAAAALMRVENWAIRKDGADNGVFTRFVFRPIKAASDAYRHERSQVLRKYRDLLAGVNLGVGRISAPELGYEFGFSKGGSGKAELLHAILHTGNDSNKRKLLLGRKWADVMQDGETVDTGRWERFIERMIREGVLTKADFDFAQGVWDLLESLKPAAQKTHRDVFGRYFDEITANPVTNSLGTWRGGYVPAMTDAEVVKDAKTRDLAEAENSTMAFAFPATAKGFTKARVEYNKPLLLDLRALAGHIDKVLLFSHLEQPVRDVRRVLTSGQVAEPMHKVDPAAFGSLITPWLNRAARQQVETPIPGDGGAMRVLSKLRARAGMAAMMANVANTAQQITGFSIAAVKVPPRHLMSAAHRWITSPRKTSEAVAEASIYMRDRMDNEAHAMTAEIRQILLNPSLYERAQDWSARHAYFMQSAIDNVMGPIIWTGAYNNALEQGQSEDDARATADGVVRQTQGSTLPEDISRIETGNAWWRMFAQFAGYFNMQANLLGTEFSNQMHGLGLRRGMGKGLYIFTLGFLVPALLSELIVQAFRGGPDDDDKDGETLDDWLAALGMGSIRSAVAMVPVAGQAANYAINLSNTRPYDDRISTAPAISMLESAVRAPFSVYDAAANDKSAQKAVRDVATLISLTTGLPANAIARPVGYVAGMADDKINPTSPADTARGLLTGVASPGSKP